MAPYARDAGLTHAHAQRLADEVRAAAAATTAVEREGKFFVVVVVSATGTHTLRDEADWTWLRGRLADGR